ncbi:SDR family NAD(P)-dependent oxidoreductase [Ferruginibacter paludis]|uniref:SDR family NAD(P)-dependent oxidoreductase n=1 Tax=Ferruginibacter paludis TaxID=1310417 RepID=UPI0025B29836|nr:SDR family NAD(P)-dependent oxidoreductase [Ferruginibacter paludis]MDN3656610.1 SDR family NAD(P)-dependent oxidoreductase [Ferruginibacter paludis]
MKVQNKVIVVTGGGSGMGREMVLNLLAKGATVIALDINKTALEETSALAGSNKEKLACYELDITNKEAVEQCVDKIISVHKHVDGLINNAGIIQPFVKLNELGYEEIERVIKVNFYGTLYMTKAFLPHLLTRPEAHIVNVSSMGGFLPVPGQTMYGATKAAVKLMTEGLRSELMDTTVRVSVVFPGAVSTNITANSGLGNPSMAASKENNSFTMLSASKAAQLIIDGMEENRYHILVGKDARMMDLLSRLNPGYAAKLIYSKMKGLLVN